MCSRESVPNPNSLSISSRKRAAPHHNHWLHFCRTRSQQAAARCSPRTLLSVCGSKSLWEAIKVENNEMNGRYVRTPRIAELDHFL